LRATVVDDGTPGKRTAASSKPKSRNKSLSASEEHKSTASDSDLDVDDDDDDDDDKNDSNSDNEDGKGYDSNDASISPDSSEDEKDDIPPAQRKGQPNLAIAPIALQKKRQRGLEALQRLTEASVAALPPAAKPVEPPAAAAPFDPELQGRVSTAGAMAFHGLDDTLGDGGETARSAENEGVGMDDEGDDVLGGLPYHMVCVYTSWIFLFP
jgi:hypothetical protein